jgi:hypothetical protein
VTAEKLRKYNNLDDLDELCRSFIINSEADTGAAIEYCKSFLMLLEEKKPNSGAVLSSRPRSH